jgi:hypothetical protein
MSILKSKLLNLVIPNTDNANIFWALYGLENVLNESYSFEMDLIYLV